MLLYMQGTVKGQPDCRDSSLEKLVLELFWSGRKRDDGYSIHRGKLYSSKVNFTTRNMAGTSPIHHLCSNKDILRPQADTGLLANY